MTFLQNVKPVKKSIKKLFSREKMFKLIIVVSTLALLATSILPYII